jgi:hypothetical protein
MGEEALKTPASLVGDLAKKTKEAREKKYWDWRKEHVNPTFFDQLKTAANNGINYVRIAITSMNDLSLWQRYCTEHNFKCDEIEDGGLAVKIWWPVQ